MGDESRKSTAGHPDVKILAEEIVNTVRTPMLVLENNLRVLQANTSFYHHFKVEPGETVGRQVYTLGNGQWDIPGLHELLEKILPENSSFNDFEVQHAFEDIGQRTMLLNARRIDHLELILLSMEDITDREQIQKELREKEERFRVLVEAASLATWEADASGMAVKDSPHWRACTGQKLEEFLGSGWLNAVHPEDREYAERKWREAVEETDSFEAEFRLRSIEGGWRWTQVHAAPIQDTDCSVLKWVGMNLDITERKQVEEALRESQKKFRKMFHSNPIPTVVSTLEDGRIIDVNHAFEKITEFSREQAVGKTAFELNLWRSRVDRQRITDLLLNRNSVDQEEIEIVTRSGEIKILLASAESIVVGGEKCFIASAMDVTERKKAQEAYLACEKDFREAFAHAPIGMVVTDLEGNFLHINEAYCRMTGYSQEELLQPGYSFQKHTHPEDLDTNIDEHEKLLRGDIPAFFLEKRYIRKDGQVIWVRVSATARRDAERRPFQIVGLVEDVTNRRLARAALEESREELRKAKESAEEASRAKSDFLANMSHEIRTPMTVFMAAIDHLQTMESNPERREILDMADNSARRLHTLIDDILDLSRIEARRVDIKEESFDLEPCLRDVVGMFIAAARKKNIEIETDLAPNVPSTIVGDPDRLGQILINLIGNAVKFTDRGNIRVSGRRRGDLLEFSVADTGIGIPEEKRDQLFKIFSQLNGSFSRRYGGSGLGLAISKGLVELMGGEISVQSREGKGSIFTFTLPLKTQGRAPAEIPPAALGNQTPAARILLAEDEPMIRELIARLLKARGWRVETVGSGKEALSKWEEGNFDLVLMDLQMPEMNGFEATRAIRGREAAGDRHICIVGLTAHAGREIREECLKAGMDMVLIKPARMEELYSAIEGCLSDRKI